MKKISLIMLVFTAILTSCSKGNEPDSPYTPPTPTPEEDKEVTASFTCKTKQPLTVVLTNNSLNATSYVWSFGDNTTSTEKNPTHRYATKGVYKITLTASNKTYTKEASNNVTLENPTRIYISGISVKKIPTQNQYYSVMVKDDDFFTTTWASTDYALMSNANLPYLFPNFTSVLMDGLSNDEYYNMELWRKTSKTGTGTKVTTFKMTTSQILAYPDSLTGNNDNASVTTYFTYK